MYSQFKSAVDSRDLARQNRYSVSIPTLSEDENMLCQDVQIPSPNIITFDYKHQGPVKKIPYDVQYGPLVMTFNAFGDNGQPYGKFMNWIEEIFDDNYRFNDKTDYVRQIIVRELDRRGSTILTHTYHEAFPISIGDKPKSASASNTPDAFTVNFEYLYSTHE